MTRPIKVNPRFTWDYVANKQRGQHVRKKTRMGAGSSTRATICNIHDGPVSSWCNTTLAPPARKYDTSINFGFNQWQINNAS